jgi:hypothetical protein
MQFTTPAARSPSRFIDPGKLCLDGSQMPVFTRLFDAYSHAPSQLPDITPHDCQALCQELRFVLTFLQEAQALFARQISQFQYQLQQLGRAPALPALSGNRFPFEPPMPSPPPRPVAPAHSPPPPPPPAPSPIRRQSSTSDARSHKRAGVTHSERSRSVSSNPNNVWARVEPFFAALPTDRDLEQIFACRPIPPARELPDRIEHWSARYAAPAVRANGRAVMPPGPPPSPDDVAEFWTKARTWFPVEQVQQQNSSVLSHLVNAFIEVEPGCGERAYDRRAFARAHPLLPQLEEEEYARYPFEVRLQVELESLGLNHPVGHMRQTVAPFQQEIDELRATIEGELLPALERDLRDIKESIPKFRQLEKRRNERQTLADRLMQDYHTKKRLKK